MDFIMVLPNFEGKSVTMVVVDRLTNHVHFYPLSHPFKSSIVVTTLVEMVQKIHGSQNIIVSKRDLIFARNVWT